MKRTVIQVKVPRTKRRTQFLFNDGEFRPKTERHEKEYRRNQKHRLRGDYDEAFYR